MKKYLPLFVKELIFKDVLLIVDEKILMDAGVTLAGERLRVLQAIDKLRKEEDEKKKNQGKVMSSKLKSDTLFRTTFSFDT